MRVLLVEDDSLVREAVAEELRDAGFDVIEATTGDDALPLFASGGFDVLVTDIRMPGGTDGWDLAELCRKARPELPVIYMTGFSHVAHRQVAGSQILTKPFRLSDLAQAVRKLIPLVDPTADRG